MPCNIQPWAVLLFSTESLWAVLIQAQCLLLRQACSGSGPPLSLVLLGFVWGSHWSCWVLGVLTNFPSLGTHLAGAAVGSGGLES